MCGADLSLLVNILNVNIFSSYEDHIVHPVILDRVVILCTNSIVSDRSADTLVNSTHVPRQSVYDPEVFTLVENSGGHIALKKIMR